MLLSTPATDCAAMQASVQSDLDGYGHNDIPESHSAPTGVDYVNRCIPSSDIASSSNGGPLPQDQAKSHQEQGIRNSQKLTHAGLWSPASTLERMHRKHKAWLGHRQHCYLRLESLPAANMSVLPAAHGLTLFVAPTGTTELDEAVKKAAAAAAVPDVATSSQQAAAARPASSSRKKTKQEGYEQE